MSDTVTTPTHSCRESTDPRKAGWCACGRRMLEPTPPVRDLAFEDEVLALGIEGAQRVYHTDAARFAHDVRARLALGDERHGVTYLERDCVTEAADEPPDVVSWLLLDLQKRRSSCSEEKVQRLKMILVQATAASAVAAAAVEQYRQEAEEG